LPTKKALGLFGDDVAEGGVALPFRLMFQAVLFREVLDGDDDVAHNENVETLPGEVRRQTSRAKES